jgi:hypothetical protein
MSHSGSKKSITCFGPRAKSRFLANIRRASLSSIIRLPRKLTAYDFALGNTHWGRPYRTPVPPYDVNYMQRPIDSMKTCTSLVVINFLNLLPINCFQESRLIPQFPHSVEWLVLRHLWSTERIVLPCILLVVSKYFRATKLFRIWRHI